jgi:hypothetical protein
METQMKSRGVLIAAMLLLVMVAAAWAADVTGKWIAQIPGRGGQAAETTFNFKVTGTDLTGTVSAPQGDQEISEGKVTGDEISFVVKMDMRGNEIKMLYKGKVSGDEIKFERTREGAAAGGGAGRGGGGQPMEFTAKKAS